MRFANGTSRSSTVLTDLPIRHNALYHRYTVVNKTQKSAVTWRLNRAGSHYRNVLMQCSGQTETTETVIELPELTSKNYYQFLKDTEAKLIVVDFYTEWCGPCKLMDPELLLMQQAYKGRNVQFVKFNCNKENKELGKELDIKVAPTFFLYKDGEKVAEMSGAKSDKLRSLIEEHL